MNEQLPSSSAKTALALKLNVCSAASLVFSIGAFLWNPLAVLGIICGIVAIIQISRFNSPVVGWLFAITGLILSSLIVLISVYSWTLRRAHYQMAQSALCVENVHQIGLACLTYAEKHEGNLPRRFDDLKPYVTNTKIFICPQATDTNRYSYEFVGVTNKWNGNANLTILREIEPRHGGKRTFLFDDGHVELRADSNL
jgi:prepilin-type processing-associated H-X9-DG protein